MNRRAKASGVAALLVTTIFVTACAPHDGATRQTSPPTKTAAVGMNVADRTEFRFDDFRRSPVACIFFVGTDCPISNAYAPEIGRIIDEYDRQGVAFFVVYALRDQSPAAVAEHAQAFGLRGHVLLDANLQLAQALGATRMPEVVVLPPTGEPVYRGRIDDRYPAPGAKRREHPTTHDLRDALDAFLAGRPIATPRTQAVGCHLDFSR